MGKFKKFGPKTAKTGDESSNKNNLQGVTKKKNKHPSPINKTKINQNETVKQEVIKSIKKEKLSVPNDKMKVEKPKPKSVIDEIIETHAPSQTSKNKKKGKRQSQSVETKSVQKSGKKNAENMKNKQKSELPVEKMETNENSGNKKKSRKRKKKLGDATTAPGLEGTKFQPKVKKQKKSLVNGGQQDVKEPSSNPKTKKDEPKPKFKKETVKTEGKETNSKPDQKSKKKFEANGSGSVEDAKDNRNSRSIYIGNVPVTFKKKKLLKLLKEKGKVERLWTRGFIPKSDKISKKTAAIANLLRENHPPVSVYVLYKTAAEAQEALTLNGALFDDHRLRVTLSQNKHFPAQKGVFVGNLPYNVTDDDLFDMFSKCGEIVTTRVIRDNSGKGKGFAYVNFSSADAVELALKLNDEKLHDREIRVTRMKNEKQIKKIQKKKAPAANAALPKQKPKKLKTKGGPPSDKSSDKFQKKKKKLNSVELKKKVLAKKLTSKKRKEKTSE